VTKTDLMVKLKWFFIDKLMQIMYIYKG